MSRTIDRQRCFKIPKAKLDLFLVQLTMSRDNLVHFEAEYIFDCETYYDVVVNTYGSYPYVENSIENFVSRL